MSVDAFVYIRRFEFEPEDLETMRQAYRIRYGGAPPTSKRALVEDYLHQALSNQDLANEDEIREHAE